MYVYMRVCVCVCLGVDGRAHARVCVHTDRLPIQIFTLHSKHHTWTGENLSEMQTQVGQINTTNQQYYKYTHKGATDLNERALVMVSEELIIPNNQ